MNENNLSDFINCNINITDIVQVYGKTDKNWKRNCIAKRECEGILFFKSGAIHYDFDEFSFDAKAGDVIKLPSGISYGGVKMGNDDNVFYVADFVVKDKDELLKYPIPMAFHTENDEKILEMFEKTEKIWNDKAPLYKIETKNLIGDILLLVAKEYLSRTYGVKKENITLDICEYIKENAYNPDLKIRDVAEKFYISETHLRRLFKKELCMSPLEYVSNLRNSRAKELLASTDIPIYEIAEKCGYGSQFYFSNAFKKENGISCKEFREIMKEKHYFE